MNLGKKIIEKHKNMFENIKSKSTINIAEIFAIPRYRSDQLIDTLMMSAGAQTTMSEFIKELLSEAKTEEELIFISMHLGRILQMNSVNDHIKETIELILTIISNDCRKILTENELKLAKKIADSVGDYILAEISKRKIDTKKQLAMIFMIAAPIIYATTETYAEWKKYHRHYSKEIRK